MQLLSGTKHITLKWYVQRRIFTVMKITMNIQRLYI